MSDNIYKPEKGDRVRVVLEGVATDVDPDGAFEVRIPGGTGSNYVYSGYSHVVSIEEIVETFGSGDVVRSKIDGVHRALGTEGYLVLEDGESYKYGQGCSLADFTSVFYEKIDLSTND